MTRRLPRRHAFRIHFWVFLLGASALLWLGGPGFWLAAFWSVALALHFLIASAGDVDDEWVEERIDDLKTRSYDFDHIRSIERRIKQHDPSVEPHLEKRLEQENGPDRHG